MRNKIVSIIVILVGIVLFTILAIGVKINSIESFDLIIYNFINNIKSDRVTSIFKIITFLASTIWFVILLIVCLIFYQKRKLTIKMILNISIVATITFFLKNIFERERPLELMLVSEKGYSFPSGHSVCAMAFYGYLIYILHNSKLKKSIKIPLCIVLGVLIILIGVSRIYLGVHYASDVLAGFIIAILYLIAFIYINKLIER